VCVLAIRRAASRGRVGFEFPSFDFVYTTP
jgi:hypothetical protein